MSSLFYPFFFSRTGFLIISILISRLVLSADDIPSLVAVFTHLQIRSFVAADPLTSGRLTTFYSSWRGFVKKNTTWISRQSAE